MEIIVLAVLSTAFLAVGFALGMTFSFGGLKEENERLNNELHRLTDRDSRGRFTRKK